MGEFFTSFDSAWSFFQSRADPLEDFFAEFPEDADHVLEGWLVEPSPAIRAAAGEIQAAVSHLDWLFPIPEHFLHVWIGLRERIGEAWREWPNIDAFPIEYAGVNCFHAAVVVEVAGPMRQLVSGTPNDLPVFLPHMTVAVTRQAHAPDELRDTLISLRESVLGSQIVGEVACVRFPAGRTTLFQPWTVERLASLR